MLVQSSWRCSPIRAITRIVVEHQDRATRFEFRFLETLLGLAGWRIEVVKLAKKDREDLWLIWLALSTRSQSGKTWQRRAEGGTEAIVKQLKAEEDTERPSSAPLLYKRRGDEKLLRTA
jgi:putative resolvase